jgi:hypothetical protein
MKATNTNTTEIEVVESYRVAIKCKFLRVTNHRGARIAVQRGDGDPDPNRLVIPWDDALSVSENYAEAVRLYTTKMGWEGKWHVATTSPGAVAVWGGYVPTETER